MNAPTIGKISGDPSTDNVTMVTADPRCSLLNISEIMEGAIVSAAEPKNPEKNRFIIID